MKTITCKQMGGTCDAPITASSYDELNMLGMKHLEEVHPEMAADIKKMSPDDPMMVKWDEETRKLWAETAEV